MYNLQDMYDDPSETQKTLNKDQRRVLRLRKKAGRKAARRMTTFKNSSGGRRGSGRRV